MGEDKRSLAKIIGFSGLAFAGLVAMFFLGNVIGLRGGYYGAEHDHKASQIQQAAAQSVDHCFSASQGPPSTRECVTHAVEASEAAKQAEENLDAQRKLAEYSWWLMIFQLAGIPITAAGILGLIITIAQGREANAINSDTAKRELRAYVGIRKYEHTPSTFAVDGDVTFELANYGQSPAVRLETEVSITTAAFADEPAIPPEWAYVGTKTPFDIPPTGPIHRCVRFPEEVSNDMLDLEGGNSALYVRLVVSYLDIFKRRWTQTTYFYARGQRYMNGDLLPFEQTAEECEEPRRNRPGTG